VDLTIRDKPLVLSQDPNQIQARISVVLLALGGFELELGPNLGKAVDRVVVTDTPVLHQFEETFFAREDTTLTDERVDATKAGMDRHDIWGASGSCWARRK
jgi:hypothetical protein